jgi:D-methionine transport system ATP-binding protein
LKPKKVGGAANRPRRLWRFWRPVVSHFPFPSASPGADAQASDVIRLSGVARKFGATAALSGVDLAVKRGEILGVIGRSGAGKSTLIRCLNGLERPDAGEILVEGRDISKLDERALQPLRRRIGMVFQHFNLLSAKTVEENVALPLKIDGVGKQQRLARARELLDLVGLTEKARAFPASLSGGQKQRVGIARALAARPALLLSDEATSALDPETTRSILALLKDINRNLSLTIVLVTHEMEVVRAIADRVAVIDAGRIVEEGPVWQIFADPAADITKALLADSRPRLAPHIAQNLRPEPPGEAVLGVDLVGDAAQTAVFQDLASEFAGSYRIVQGAVDYIQQQSLARFFLAVKTDNAMLPALVTTALLKRNARVEALGYV